MKKLLTTILFPVLFAVLLAGCGGQPSASPTPALSASPTPDAPIETLPVEETAPPDDDPDAKPVTYQDWTYYLAEDDPIVVEFHEDPPLHRKKADGSGDEDLGIRGFDFDIIGDYVYVDSHHPDLDANGARTWGTTRINPDGSTQQKLEYGSMSARLVPEGEQNFYFTSMGENALYVSDFSNENVTALAITLPDKSDLDKKLGNEKVLQLDINDVKDGWINFDVTFSTQVGIQLYAGSYKMTPDGKTIEKVKGTYYNYGTQEKQ
ncbi:MAG: hypothetical protein ACYCX2_02380 [Christensenellales bacterium]